MSESKTSPVMLVVDDDYEVNEVLRRIFERQGYTIKSAYDGIEALEMIEAGLPDIILLDVIMPQMDGLTLLGILRENPETADVPIVLVTARSDLETDILYRLGRGADEYIVKPFDIQEFIFRVEVARKRVAALASINAKRPEHHVFLSYSRRDAALMRRLCDDFQNAGLKVWVDDDKLSLGTPAWEHEIVSGIKNTQCMIALMSPSSQRSIWVGRELALAETLQKRIFPILINGNEGDAIPFRLMSHQWVDARHNYSEAFEKLAGAVKKYLGVG